MLGMALDPATLPDDAAQLTYVMNVLLAGTLTGFLPCGLVYGFLTLASSSARLRRNSSPRT